MRRPILASYLLLAAFLILSAIRQNTEFLIYAVVLVPVVALLHYTDRIFDYKAIALWGFAVWMLLHLIGGLFSVGSVRVYDLMLIGLVGEPYWILKYDQALHFFCYIVVALLLSSVVMHVTKKRASALAVAVIIILAATGVGAINEILEFIPVILFNSPGPGGYTNTAIDIVMNFLGAIAGTFLFKKV